MPIKKAFKKLSKVANKIADKIVPKEIAPLLPIAAAFVPGMLGPGASALARFGIPQALAALGSAKTTGEINPVSQGLAALASFASMPKGLTPAEEAYLQLEKPSEFMFRGPDAITGGKTSLDLTQAAKQAGNIIPEGFDMSKLDLSFADRARSSIGDVGRGLKDAFQDPGLKGLFTKGSIGTSAALSDQGIKMMDAMKAEQEQYEADQALKRAMYDEGVTGLTDYFKSLFQYPMFAEGGITNAAPGMPNNMQVDGRNGTFIPMGVKEKADDVPAMLSKNEFVMTADAVRGMGGGDVEVGAQRMYDLMNNLEARV